MAKSKKKRRIKILLLVSVLPFFFGGSYVLSRLILGDEVSVLILTAQIDEAMTKALLEAGESPQEIKKNQVKKQQGDFVWYQTELVANIGGSLSLEQVSEGLKQALKEPAIVIKESQTASGEYQKVSLTFYYHQLALYQVLLRQQVVKPGKEPAPQKELQLENKAEQLPKVAIIVDDVGYDIGLAMTLINLRHPLTISIFPQLPHSRNIAEAAHKVGHEIMMHLPMEPGETLRRNPGFIMQEMNKKELIWILDRDLDSVPHVSGVNNHQGSKMTRDRAAMKLVMEYLGAKDLYFVDSLTTSDSIAFKTARKCGLNAGENDVFLDNEKKIGYIEERLKLLVEEARRKGKAIGICHLHPVTIQALRETLPILEGQEVKLVYVSEVVE